MMRRLGLLPPTASTIAREVDALFWFLVIVATVAVTGVATAIVVFMLRYRRRPGGPVNPPTVRGSYVLEIIWSAIPFVVVMVMFFWGASLFARMHQPPADALPIWVVGRQWMWKLQHPQGRSEINELHVPVGRPVRLTLTSEDVIHSFYVPAFRVKQDAVPGRYTSLWFEATRVGEYHLFCAEYCGTLHSGMIGRVVVMEPADYQAWLQGEAAPPGFAAVTPAEAGAALFQRHGCTTCHRDEAGTGPPLAGVFGSRVTLADGTTVVADETYLRESILDPRARVVAGYEPVMPTYRGVLNEEGIVQLIEFLKSLAPPE